MTESKSLELVEIIKVNNLEPTKSELILNSFREFFDKAKTYEAKAKAISEMSDEKS